jgi:hypothetical protein
MMQVRAVPLDKKAATPEPLVTREVTQLPKEQVPLEPEEAYLDLEMQLEPVQEVLLPVLEQVVPRRVMTTWAHPVVHKAAEQPARQQPRAQMLDIPALIRPLAEPHQSTIPRTQDKDMQVPAQLVKGQLTNPAMEALQLLVPELLLTLEPLEDIRAVQLEPPEPQGLVRANMTIPMARLAVILLEVMVSRMAEPLAHQELAEPDMTIHTPEPEELVLVDKPPKAQYHLGQLEHL